MSALHDAFDNTYGDKVDLQAACEVLLRHRESLPPLHFLRLAAITDPTVAPMRQVLHVSYTRVLSETMYILLTLVSGP